MFHNEIKILSHWNDSLTKWQSNYEFHNHWPGIERKVWATNHFINVLESAFYKKSDTYSFSVEPYTETASGFYLIYYGWAWSIVENQGLGFLTRSQIEKINQGSMKLLIAFTHETFDNGISPREWFWNFCERLSMIGIWKTNSVAILTSTDFEYSPQPDPRCEFIYYPWFELEFQQSLGRHLDHQIPELNFENKTKTFINLNLLIRPHRFLMIMYLLYHKLENHGHISWKNEQNKNWREILRGTSFDDYNFSWQEQLAHFADGFAFFHFVRTVNVLKTLSLDDVERTPTNNDTWLGAKTFYQSAWIDIVNETHFELYGDTFLTEKTFKPLAYGLPFIFNSTKNHLKSVKKLGYHSFPELFDERYDDMPCNLEKIANIGNQVIALCQDPEKIKTIPDLREKILFNQNLFWNKNHADQLGKLLCDFWNKGNA